MGKKAVRSFIKAKKMYAVKNSEPHKKCRYILLHKKSHKCRRNKNEKERSGRSQKHDIKACVNYSIFIYPLCFIFFSSVKKVKKNGKKLNFFFFENILRFLCVSNKVSHLEFKRIIFILYFFSSEKNAYLYFLRLF